MSESYQRRLRYVVVESLYESETSTRSARDVYARRIKEVSETDDSLAAPRRQRQGEAMVDGIESQREDLDRHIAEAAPRFPLDSMAIVDRNILRLAIWELVADTSAPTGAVINEAVELARRYGGEKSPAFVNGVLRTVAEKVRSTSTALPPSQGTSQNTPENQENQ